MADLMIEGLPDALLARIAEQAAAHGRCVNSEVIVLVARSLACGLRGSSGGQAVARPALGPMAIRGPSGAERVGWGADEL